MQTLTPLLFILYPGSKYAEEGWFELECGLQKELAYCQLQLDRLDSYVSSCLCLVSRNSPLAESDKV